jgi:hypothetical protein
LCHSGGCQQSQRKAQRRALRKPDDAGALALRGPTAALDEPNERWLSTQTNEKIQQAVMWKRSNFQNCHYTSATISIAQRAMRNSFSCSSA